MRDDRDRDETRNSVHHAAAASNTVGDARGVCVCVPETNTNCCRQSARQMDSKTKERRRWKKGEVTKMRHVEYLESVIRIKPRGYVGSTDEIVITSAEESWMLERERQRGPSEGVCSMDVADKRAVCIVYTAHGRRS